MQSAEQSKSVVRYSFRRLFGSFDYELSDGVVTFSDKRLVSGSDLAVIKLNELGETEAAGKMAQKRGTGIFLLIFSFLVLLPPIKHFASFGETVWQPLVIGGVAGAAGVFFLSPLCSIRYKSFFFKSGQPALTVVWRAKNEAEAAKFIGAVMIEKQRTRMSQIQCEPGTGG